MTLSASRFRRPHLRLLSLLVLAWSAGCDSDPAQPGEGPVEPIRVEGRFMGPLDQEVHLFEGDSGQPLAGATVTVNGVVLTEVVSGEYRGQLSQALAAGAELRLRVEADDRVVEGVASVPATPELTEPAADQFFDRDADTDFAWVSGVSPDYFEIALHWGEGGAGSSEYLEVAGTARSGSIDSSAVPAEVSDLRATVHAFNRGAFSGPAHEDSDMRVRVGAPEAVLDVFGPMLVRGGVMSVANQNVSLYRGDDPVTGATVTANGVVLDEVGPGFYSGSLQSALQPDEELRLRVEAGPQVVEAVATIIEFPVLTAPADGDPFDPAADLDFAWTAARDPDYFEMSLSWVKDSAGSGTRVEVPGSARAGAVSSAAVPADPESVRARIYAYLRGTFTGPAHPDSDMRVRLGGGSSDLTLNTPGP